MPELLTKHPDAALAVLRSAGLRCGEGAPQTILTACPRDAFCAAPGGEVCVYGLGDIPKLTQMTAVELSAGGGQAEPVSVLGLTLPDALVLAVALAAGFVLGRFSQRKPRGAAL